MYLRHCTLQGFQSHRDSRLEFHPGVNVLVGSSRGGKSAVLRALSWVLFNALSGSAFIHWGLSESAVSVETDTGTTIIRERRRSGGNSYVVNGMSLNTVGTEVPAPVREAVGWPMELSMSDVQATLLAGQFDRPYFLQWRGSEVTQMLGRLSSTDLIDVVLKDLSTDYEKAKRVGEDAEGERVALQAVVDQLAWVETAEAAGLRCRARLDALTARDRALLQVRTIHAKAAALHTARAAVQARMQAADQSVACAGATTVLIDRLARIRDPHAPVRRARGLWAKLAGCVLPSAVPEMPVSLPDRVSAVQAVRAVHVRWRQLRAQVSQAAQALSDLPAVSLDHIAALVQRVIIFTGQARVIQRQQSRRVQIQQVTEAVQQAHIAEAEAHTAWAAATQDAVCPFCGQALAGVVV